MADPEQIESKSALELDDNAGYSLTVLDRARDENQ